MSFWKGCIKPSKLRLSRSIRRLQALALLPPLLSRQPVNMCNSSVVVAVFKNKTKQKTPLCLDCGKYHMVTKTQEDWVLWVCCSIQWISVQRDCSCIEFQNDSEFFFLFGLLHKYLSFLKVKRILALTELTGSG